MPLAATQGRITAWQAETPHSHNSLIPRPHTQYGLSARPNITRFETTSITNGTDLRRQKEVQPRLNLCLQKQACTGCLRPSRVQLARNCACWTGNTILEHSRQTRLWGMLAQNPYIVGYSDHSPAPYIDESPTSSTDPYQTVEGL